VMLAVSDTGIGMDTATQSRIFEPFFTTKPQGKGTGLGLATVYGVIKQNRGHVAVYSELGKGTAFKIYWPKAANKPAHTQTLKYEGGPPKGSEAILLVEDDDQVRAFAARMLAYLGYSVIEARDGLDALEKSHNAATRIDLLVTDVIMPKMGGPELATRLTSANPHLKVLYASGYTANAIVHHGVLDKDVNFLPKPYSLHELAGKVRSALDL
jgi:two-component system cell cycle sensor histidine kinase/response regulator CckA